MDGGTAHGEECSLFVLCPSHQRIARPILSQESICGRRSRPSPRLGLPTKPNHLRCALRRCLTEITIRRRLLVCLFLLPKQPLLLANQPPSFPSRRAFQTFRRTFLPPPSFLPARGLPRPASRHGPLPAPWQHVPCPCASKQAGKQAGKQFPDPNQSKTASPCPLSRPDSPEMNEWAHRPIGCHAPVHVQLPPRQSLPSAKSSGAIRPLLCVIFWKPSVSCLL